MAKSSIRILRISLTLFSLLIELGSCVYIKKDLKLYISEEKTNIACFSGTFADILEDSILTCPPHRYIFISKVFYGMRDEFHKCSSKLQSDKSLNCGTYGLEFTLAHFCGGKNYCRLQSKHAKFNSLIGITGNSLWKGNPKYKMLSDKFCKVYNHAKIHYYCIGGEEHNLHLLRSLKDK